MENKKQNNYIYLVLSLALLGSIYTLNSFKKIYLCACMFTCITLIASAILHLCSFKKVVASVLLSCLVAYLILCNTDYYLNNMLIAGIITMSLVSIVISLLIGLSCSSRLVGVYSFKTVSLLSMSISALVDGIVMSVFLLSKYSATKVFAISVKELKFKLIYACAVFIIIFLCEKLVVFAKKIIGKRSF